ncbi:hypothetical protein IJG04_01820 [Candidatus Saccharibacteria bacterium]|nr:hypothetical protein [Candidatus Saccharibacteria bacterium]
MTKRNVFSVVICGVALVVSGLVSVPVFAEGPVDIRIVEMGDDGAGNLISEWQDITGAMPGMTYNAVPRIQNNGAVATSVKMCLAESGMDALGNVIELDNGTFAIEINDEYWTLDTGEDNSGVVSSPIDVCYKYNTELTAGGVTEPLFYEVSLSSELGNEHKNATFNLHLYAEAVGGLPENPDTGVNNVSYFDIVSPVLFATGGIILFAVVAYMLHSVRRRK